MNLCTIIVFKRGFYAPIITLCEHLQELARVLIDEVMYE
jgi:hypothetical protein